MEVLQRRRIERRNCCEKFCNRTDSGSPVVKCVFYASAMCLTFDADGRRNAVTSAESVHMFCRRHSRRYGCHVAMRATSAARSRLWDTLVVRLGTRSVMLR